MPDNHTGQPAKLDPLFKEIFDTFFPGMQRTARDDFDDKIVGEPTREEIEKELQPKGEGDENADAD